MWGRKLSLFLCALAVLLAFSQALAASAQSNKGRGEQTTEAQDTTTYRGGLVSPPLPKPKFTLTDTSGAPFDFFAKTQGKLTLLFFGYTHCDDVCPLQMQMIARALKKVPPGIASNSTVVFVTTDPERDSPAVLRAWLDHFDKRFVGLTGSQSAVDAAQIAANLPPARKSAVRPDGDYEVGHSSFVFTYTRDNLAHLVYPAGVQQEDFVHDLPLLAEGTWTHR